MSAYKRIVVGTYRSDTSLRAVARATMIAADAAAELTLVTAYEPERREVVTHTRDALHDEAFMVIGSAPAEAMLCEAADHAETIGAPIVRTRAVQGNPVTVLKDAVRDRDADLLVIDNVGLNSVSGRVLEPVPRAAAGKSGVEVLIVHTS